MWPARTRQERTAVTCIACGRSVARADAREYDKHGDRWDRRNKAFEHLCKACFRDLCHQPRAGLESLLVDCAAGRCDRESFLASFQRRIQREGDPAD